MIHIKTYNFGHPYYQWIIQNIEKKHKIHFTCVCKHVCQIDTDISDNEIQNEPNIIEHSSYYEFNDLVYLINNNEKS